MDNTVSRSDTNLAIRLHSSRPTCSAYTTMVTTIVAARDAYYGDTHEADDPGGDPAGPPVGMMPLVTDPAAIR